MNNRIQYGRYICLIALAVAALFASSGHSFAERQDFSDAKTDVGQIQVLRQRPTTLSLRLRQD